jgi:hypothetical protein
MKSDPTPSAMALLIDEFRQRFPLLRKIAGEFGSENLERDPWFFAFLLVAANNANPGGRCFVCKSLD